MVTMKFGGAVLRSPEGFRQMATILRKTNEPVLVVVSAFASATRDLEFAARLAAKGLPAEAHERLLQVIDDHRALMRSLLPVPAIRDALDALVEGVHAAASELLSAIAVTRQLTPKTLDKLLAFGEFLALHIARHVLVSDDLDVVGVDAGEVMITTNDHGRAVPIPDAIRTRVNTVLKPALQEHQIVLVQGFVGRGQDGSTTTMGRESSNLTATVLGSALGVREIVIWTDVEGIRSADPHLCDHTRLRPELSWSEARIAANVGLKLLYPTMIEPAESHNIPIRIACASRPNGESSLIGRSSKPCEPIVITREGAEGATDVVTVFADASPWLTAASQAVSELNEADPFFVSCDRPSSGYRFTTSFGSAPRITRCFHDALVNTPRL